MQEPTPDSVLGDFGRKTLTVGKESFTFRKEGAAYWVDVVQKGKKRSFRVRYLFGVEPLQQLLVDTGNGHLQALSVAWDARAKSRGGQRWFFLYPHESVPPGDPLHWEGAQFTWNAMCADCHSTGVQKGYAADTQSYDTRFAEIDVSCEACHGPSSLHVRAAAAKQPSLQANGFRSLKSRDRRWVFAEGAAIAHLEGARSEQEQEACAPCHSRRAELGPPGDSYHDRFRLSLLEEPLYFADGQVQDEVFEVGSFMQSRMHAAGVTCSDCHEPHSTATRARGNALCTKCHKSDVYDSAAHHFHPVESAGAACVSCHMPERTYMVIDARREHRFDVPRPDLSARTRSPDPCTSCHRDKSASWATAQLAQRNRLRTSLHFSETLRAARAREPGALSKLSALADNRSAPDIVRATALAELGRLPGPELRAIMRTAPRDESVLVRRAAAQAAAQLPPALRESAAGSLLTDRYRSVRMEAAQSFLGVDTTTLSSGVRAPLRRALEELEQSAAYRADRADGLASLADLRLIAGDAEGALARLSEAILRDPSHTAAYVNKADVLRALGREADAEAALRSGLARAGDRGALLYALGLSQIRSHQVAKALESLGEAHRLRPETTRYAFVYAVALFDTGDQSRALQVLREALAKAPADEELLATLAAYCRQVGRTEESQQYAARLAELRGRRQLPAGRDTPP